MRRTTHTATITESGSSTTDLSTTKSMDLTLYRPPPSAPHSYSKQELLSKFLARIHTYDSALSHKSQTSNTDFFRAGIAFGATHAEGIFVSGLSPHILAPRVKAIREAAAAAGRDPRAVKVVAVITPIIGRTHEEAVAKYHEAEKYASTEAGLAFWSGNAGIDISKFDLDKEILATDATIDHRVHSLASSLSYRGDDAPAPTPRNISKYIAIGANGPTPVGTAAEVADVLEEWIDIADLDGFNIGHVITPGSFEDVVDLLVPELRRRGRYAPKREPNETLTLRERVYGKGQSKLRDDHIGHNYRYENSEWYAEQDKLPKE